MKKTEPEYYPPVENLLDLIYEHYTENNPVEKNTVAGKTAKVKEKELEEWLRDLEGMDRLVDDYIGDKIPLWEKIMDWQGTVCAVLGRRLPCPCRPESHKRNTCELASASCSLCRSTLPCRQVRRVTNIYVLSFCVFSLSSFRILSNSAISLLLAKRTADFSL